MEAYSRPYKDVLLAYLNYEFVDLLKKKGLMDGSITQYSYGLLEVKGMLCSFSFEYKDCAVYMQRTSGS